MGGRKSTGLGARPGGKPCLHHLLPVCHRPLNIGSKLYDEIITPPFIGLNTRATCWYKALTQKFCLKSCQQLCEAGTPPHSALTPREAKSLQNVQIIHGKGKTWNFDPKISNSALVSTQVHWPLRLASQTQMRKTHRPQHCSIKHSGRPCLPPFGVQWVESGG